jgi:integrase/recombinase XerD
VSTTRRSLPVTAWPAADRTAWADALRDDDLFEAGPGAHLAASSRATLAHVYGRWLTAIGSADPESLSLAPGARVTRERLKVYVARLRADGVSERTIADYLDGLRRVCALIDPDVPLDWIRATANRIRASAPLPDKRERLVPPAEMLALVDQLVASGLGTGPSAAQDLRDGLILSLLVHRAPRLGNLCAMTIDGHLRRTGSGGLQIGFAAVETKGRRSLTFEIPERLVPAFDDYLAEGRQRIHGASNHTGLWPSQMGRPMSRTAIQRMVARRTRAAFGIALHPHLFRTLAASTIVVEAPELIDMVPALLHHADIRTADAHYIQADGVKASRTLADLIDELRK